MSLQGLVRRRHKKEGSLALIYTQEQVEHGFNDHPGLQTVMGHFRFGFHRFSSRQPRYFTFLRDPVQQVISHYYYSLEKPEKFRDLPKGIDSVTDFARSSYGYNLQTRFISGMDDIKGQEDKALNEAKKNLTQHFEMVGITEQFDKSLILLGQHLDWSVLFYLKGNEGERKKQMPSVSEEEITNLKSILSPDITLYKIATELFDVECNRSL